MKLSLCMIVKNEEKFIKMCLDNVLPIVDEAIIVDTGSKDSTKDIIKSYGNRVKLIEAEWENDFSKARNISIENAKGDWILVLDADEKIVVSNVNELRTLIEASKYEALKIPFYNLIGDYNLLFSNVYPKIFRNKGYRYNGEIHEQIKDLPLDMTAEVNETLCKIIHFGYLDSEYKAKDKQNRNLDILFKQLNNDENNPFIYYNLGVTYMSKGDYKTAIDYFFKCNEKLERKFPDSKTLYESDIIARVAQCLIEIKDYENCIILLNDVIKDEHFRDFVDLYYFYGNALDKLNRFEEALNMYKKCIEVGNTTKYISVSGIGSFYPKFRIAEIYEKQGKIMDAAMLYIEAVFDSKNVFKKGEQEARSFFKKYNLTEILIEFDKLVKS